MRKLLASALIGLIACAWAASAQAQSTCKYIAFGAVLTPGQWQYCFEQKQDVLGYTPVNKAGDTMTGRLVTAASTTSMAGFNLPQGAGPSAPVNGDLWTTSAGMFVRINGVTVELTGGSSSFFAGTSPITVSFPGGVVTYAFNFAVANTFTATQTFSNGTISALFSGNVGIGTMSPTLAQGLQVAGTNPQVSFYQSSAGTDAKTWDFSVISGQLLGRAVNDAYNAATNWLVVNRSGYTISNILFPNGNLGIGTTPNSKLEVNGTITTDDGGGLHIISNTNSAITISLTGTANEQLLIGPSGQWRWLNNVASFTNFIFADTGDLAISRGGLTLNSPTGGNEGAGTINAAGAYYLNGTKIAQTATSPLVITNGVIACATCLTSTPAAMTQSNDTNVTLTLGGTPATSLLQAVSLTMGWTGTLAAGRLNSNVVQSVVNDTNVTGSIAAQALTLGWTGTLANARLATMATNTIKGNATSGIASPTDLAIGSCSTAASALIWTTNTGFGCNTSITAAAVPASGLTGTTLASGVVTSSLTTVGIIGTGTWQGTKVGLAYGGTNADLSATGGASFVLKQVSSGAAITVARLACADLSDSAAGCTNAGANPTASLGLTAVNGSATTYMRSDAAPALSVAITPTWTGTHTFNNGTYSALFTGGNVGIGTTSPDSLVHSYGVQPTGTVSYPTGLRMFGMLNVDSSDAYTTQKGGRIIFSGELDTTHTHATYGAIQGVKYNAVSGNSGGGLQFLTGNNNTGNMAVNMMIDSFGNVGINTTSPGAVLEVNGTVKFDSTITATGIAAASGNDILCYTTSTGLITYASSVVGCVPSAMNLKNMIGTLDGAAALSGIASIDVGIYTYKASTGLDQREMIGLYADQICKIDDRLCHRDAQGRIDNYDKVGALALAFAGIKQLKADNDNLRAVNDNLEAWLKRLETNVK